MGPLSIVHQIFSYGLVKFNDWSVQYSLTKKTINNPIAIRMKLKKKKKAIHEKELRRKKKVKFGEGELGCDWKLDI